MGSFGWKDVTKLSCLALAFIYCLYTSINKFMVPEQTVFIFKLTPNYAACKDQSTAVTKSQCREEIAAAYKQAEDRCHGYIDNFSKCKQANSNAPCSVEGANMESCVNAVTKEVVNKWLLKIIESGSGDQSGD